MPKLRPLKPDQIKRTLERLGFERIRQSGSHVVYRHKDGRWTTVPVHKGKDVSKGLMRKILKDAKVSWEEFENLL